MTSLHRPPLADTVPPEPLTPEQIIAHVEDCADGCAW